MVNRMKRERKADSLAQKRALIRSLIEQTGMASAAPAAHGLAEVIPSEIVPCRKLPSRRLAAAVETHVPANVIPFPDLQAYS